MIVLPFDMKDAIKVQPREDDVHELMDLGLSVTDVLRIGSEDGNAKMMVEGDTVVAVFGVSSHAYGFGIPWLLSTIHTEAHTREFLRVCREEVIDMAVEYGQLINYVSAENTTAIRWLEYLGFDIEDPAPYGPKCAPFCRFTMTGA